MSKDIEISFEWSRELAIKASKMYYEYDMRNSAKRYIGWLFVALTQFGMVGALKHDSFGLLYISTFLVLYWYYGRWYIRKFMIDRYYNRVDLDRRDVVFYLRDDGLHSEDNLISWNEIFKVVRFDSDVLIHTSTNTLFFQRASFKSYDDLEKFLEIMRDKGKM